MRFRCVPSGIAPAACRKRIAGGEKHTRELVRETLYEQIFGVDVEATAVEIAAFSLCLTAFELDPEPDSTDQLRFERELKGQNLFVGDAFEPDAPFAKTAPFRDKQFSVIVGNPPWTRHKGPRSPRPSSNPSHVAYCEGRNPKVTLPISKSSRSGVCLSRIRLLPTARTIRVHSRRQALLQPRGPVA